jgi:HPr kinase/phosphorylase
MNTVAQEYNRSISVSEFLRTAPKELDLEMLVGSTPAESREITSERVQKLGLALAGFPDYVHPGRIQMVGISEIAFVDHLGPEARKTAFQGLDPAVISCILVTKSLVPPAEMVETMSAADVPILRTPLVSSRAIGLVTDFLQIALAPEITLHGVLLEMYGIGVMIIGDSGIGKSECALDLISRGHRLVSDDAVRIKRIGGRLEGRSPALTFEHLELHGLGIINVRDLFGVSSVCETINIELCIELRKWDEIDDVERIGLEMRKHEIFGLNAAKFILPVSPGRNLSTLVETAVRVYLLRSDGKDAAQALIEKHSAIVGGGR